MKWQVFVTAEAQRDLEAAVDWWAEHRSTEQARKWYNAVAEAIESLASHPDRCPRALESDSFRYELRQLNCGVGQRRPHRIVFVVRENTVIVLRVRHLAQDELRPGSE